MKYFPATSRTVFERRPLSPATSRSDEMFPGQDLWAEAVPGGGAEALLSAVSTPVLFKPAPRKSPETEDRARVEIQYLPVSPGHFPGPSDWTPVKVLLVDDNAGVIDLVTQVLESAGYQVCAADNGESAWEKWNQFHFDLVITDHAMPRLTGVELLRRLRAAGATVPVILMSGNLPRNVPDLEALLPPGNTMEKPFSLAGLLSRAQELLAHGRRTRAHDVLTRSRDAEHHAALLAEAV